jgi:hypothetical protein
VSDYEFMRRAGGIINSGQGRTLLLSGNVYDIFRSPDGKEYVPLTDALRSAWDAPDRIIITYEINGPLRFHQPQQKDLLRDAWTRWRHGGDVGDLAIERMLSPAKARAKLPVEQHSFDEQLHEAIGRPTVALEFMRQLCLCARTVIDGKYALVQRLMIIIEAADLLLPDAPITQLNDADRHRVSILHDWFSDPGFVNGDDAVVLLAESRGMLNQRVMRLPQMLEVTVPAPNEVERGAFIDWFARQPGWERAASLGMSPAQLARHSAGLSNQALMQLLKAAIHSGVLDAKAVTAKVEAYIQSQLGEGVVEFSKPQHTLENVIGFAKLKQFLREELIPRLRRSDDGALPGAAVCGPIGGGKTFIFEAVAAELGMPVLVLKNIRSQWFGQTDVIFERLRHVLEALSQVVIFVDEADTQFGGVGADTHETERRLTGKIQAMMADPRMRGRIIWLLMTARIHLLSPDIRRPGRVGDLIIPILDPSTPEDKRAFWKWTLRGAHAGELDEAAFGRLEKSCGDYSAASFAALRSELAARREKWPLPLDDVLSIANDHLSPAIAETRRYQTLQALINCTRRSLLPDPGVSVKEREAWEEEIRRLEARGLR